MALHEGTIGVTDAPGGGALFQVEVPLGAPEGVWVRKGSEPQAQERDAVVQGTLSELAPVNVQPVHAGEDTDTDRPLVLVVEDNPELNRFIAEVLSTDFRVRTAADGQEGLERARGLSPDLIVSDIMMPRMSGAEMIGRLREDRALDGLPILVLSAKADDALRLELLRNGAQDYVVKPFSAEELLVRVRNLVTMKRARQVLEAELALKSDNLEALARESARRKRQLEHALEETQLAREQAEAASRAKGEFLTLVSHEMNTPLTSLILTLKSVERSGVQPENTWRLERLRQSSQRLRHLVSGIIEYSRIGSGRLDLEVESFDVGALASQVLEELVPEASEKGLKLELAVSEVPPLRSDARLIRIVLGNLLGNAIRYTQQGQVALSLRCEARGHICEVRDTGPGIPREHWSRIFEPFEQLEPLRHKSTPGLGLGLALVKQLVEALQGQLELTSELGVGSTFRVVLPSLEAVDTRGPAPLAAKHRPSIPPA